MLAALATGYWWKLLTTGLHRPYSGRQGPASGGKIPQRLTPWCVCGRSCVE